MIRYFFELQECSFYYWSSMLKHGKQTTTRHSTTLIQSKVIPLEPNKGMVTRMLLQYKWLKPQMEAYHLHHFQQIYREFKMKSIKDTYINSLQSVNILPQLLKKYYLMQEISKEVKKVITLRIKHSQVHPIIRSAIYKLIRQKYAKMIREKEILLLKQKINPKFAFHPKEPTPIIQKSNKKITFHKVKQKSPSKSNSKRSHQEQRKQKLNNTKIQGFQSSFQNSDENYGLRYYHIKNKPSHHNCNSNEKKPQKVNAQQNDHKQNLYYFNYSRPKHKKTNSNATPQKSIQTSRKVASKESFYLRSQKAKTESSKQKEKLKFNKKHKY